MSTPEPIVPTTPIENVPRGTLLALLIIPAGIIVWVIIWEIGFIASIVALGVALGAMWLYRFGSGGPISRTGAIRVTIIVVITLLLSFFSGLLWDFAQHYHLNVIDALRDRRLASTLASQITEGGVGVSLALAAVFGVLGCFSVLRTAFVQTRNASVASSAAAGYGQPVPNPYTVAPPTAPAAPAAAPDAVSDETPTSDPDTDAKR